VCVCVIRWELGKDQSRRQVCVCVFWGAVSCEFKRVMGVSDGYGVKDGRQPCITA